MMNPFGRAFGTSGSSDEARGWRVGHQGRDRMYYEELHGGAWRRIDIDGEMLMGRAHHVIYFASPERWRQYPEWARERRDEIIARITSEFREPDYEYYGIADGGAPEGQAPEKPAPPETTIALGGAPPRKAAMPQQGRRALLLAVLLLFAIAGALGWLVVSGIASGETYLPLKRAYLIRVVSRTQEPGMYWLSIGVYAIVGAGALTLAVLGMRERRRLAE